MEEDSSIDSFYGGITYVPDDVLTENVFPFLGQNDVAALGRASRRMLRLTSASLRRSFRCATCHVSIFQLSDLIDVSSSIDTQPRHADALPRRSFLELRPRSVPRLSADGMRGKANFLARRHMRQIGEADVSSDGNIDILRCTCCGVYIGFQTSPPSRPAAGDSRQAPQDDTGTSHKDHEHESFLVCCVTRGYCTADRRLSKGRDCSQFPLQSAGRLFVGKDYVELVNGDGVRIAANGEVEVTDSIVRTETHKIAVEDVWVDGGKGRLLYSSAVFCRTPSCGSILFRREDVLPWSHVLASSRLADMDAFLEWEHVWGTSRPALFVKRMSMAYAVEQPRWVKLRQGTMEVGEVSCQNCGQCIGWRFLSELPHLDNGCLFNFDQTGRFGVFRDAVRLWESETAERLVAIS